MAKATKTARTKSKVASKKSASGATTKSARSKASKKGAKKASKKSIAKKAGPRRVAKKAARKSATKSKGAKKSTKTNKLGVKNSLVNNINARKKKDASRPKSKSTVSKKSYRKMQEGWKDK